jgi:hypothetical protein
MKAPALLVIGMLAAAGCGSDKPGVRVELADARLVFAQPDGSSHVVTLTADGAVSFDGEPVIKVRKDGQIEAEGQLFARLQPDGRVFAHGVATNVRINEDAVFEMDGAPELTIGADGAVTGPLLETMDHPMLPLDGAKVRYEGPPGARRATMLGFAAFVTNLPGARRPGT